MQFSSIFVMDMYVCFHVSVFSRKLSYKVYVSFFCVSVVGWVSLLSRAGLQNSPPPQKKRM